MQRLPAVTSLLLIDCSARRSRWRTGAFASLSTVPDRDRPAAPLRREQLIAAAPRLRARLRDDRRATYSQPRTRARRAARCSVAKETRTSRQDPGAGARAPLRRVRKHPAATVRWPIHNRGARPSRQRSAPIENPCVRIGRPVSFLTMAGYPDASDRLRGVASRCTGAAQRLKPHATLPRPDPSHAPAGVDHIADEPKQKCEAAPLSATRTGTTRWHAVSSSLPDHLLAGSCRHASTALVSALPTITTRSKRFHGLAPTACIAQNEPRALS